MSTNQEFSDNDFFSLEQQIFQCMDELMTKRDAVDSIRLELVHAAQTNLELEQRLERERRDGEVSRSQLSFTSNKVHEWQAERSAAASKEARLEAELEATKAEREALLNRATLDQSKLDSMSRTIEEQNRRIQTLSAFEASTRVSEAKIRSSMAALQDQIKKFEMELRRLEGHTKTAATLGMQMQTMQLVYEKETKELKTRTEAAEARASVLAAELEVEKNRSINEENECIKETFIEKWEQSKTTMNQRLNQYEESHVSLTRILDQAFQSQAQLQCLVSSLQNQLAQSEKQISRLQEEIEQLKEEFNIKEKEEKMDKECQTENN